MNEEKRFELTESQLHMILKSIDRSIEYANQKIKDAKEKGNAQNIRRSKNMLTKYLTVRAIMESLAD